MSWRDRSACADRDPKLWFPTVGFDSEAVALCMVCPVRGDCLAYAMDLRIEDGIWGGLTSQDRRLRRGTRQPRRPKLPVDSPSLAHGHGGYVRGCRCETCRAGMRASVRRYRARRRAAS